MPLKTSRSLGGKLQNTCAFTKTHTHTDEREEKERRQISGERGSDKTTL